MRASGEKLLRDPVHDLIVFDLCNSVDRVLLELIDTPEFQRLRRIRQIGMASQAFPGGEHSRFCHSLGVLHLARRMFERLRKGQNVPKDAELVVACAALLHDVGHGPFSHVIERFFAEKHEAWTRRIVLSEDTGVNRVLRAADPALPQRVADLLAGKSEPAWLARMVSSQLDADRFDYLLRDSLMTGVKYGVFDLERLLLMLCVSDDGSRIYVQAKGLLPVEKYLQSRYHMYRQVYFHKTVSAGEAMLTALLARARTLVRAGRCPGVPKGGALERLLRGGEAAATTDYLAFDDVTMQGLLAEWATSADAVLCDLATRLRERRLFKTLEIENFDEQDLLVGMRVEQAKAAIQDAGLDPEYYLLFLESRDAPYRPYDSREGGPAGTIWFEAPEVPGGLCDIKEVSPTIRAFTESPYSIWRAVFPAIHSGHNLRERLREVFQG